MPFCMRSTSIAHRKMYQFSEHDQDVLDQSLKLLKQAVDGLVQEPQSLDHWHQANYCLRTVAALMIDANPNHFGDTDEPDRTDQK